MNTLLRRVALSCLAVASLVAAPGRAMAEGTPCSRVVAVGDLHGGYDAFVSILRETGLLDAEGRWAGKDACLVQTGDVVDRGDRSRDILDLLMRLTEEAPGRVHAILGNHEVMNLVGDLRYVSPGEYGAFASEETAEERERGYALYLEAHPELPPGDAAARAAFDEACPPGWFAHRRAFAADGRYGGWLLSRRFLLKLDGTLFVHGGLSPLDAALGVEELDRLVREDLRDYLSARDALVRLGWLPALSSFGEDFFLVRRRMEQETASGASDETLELPRRFVALADNRFSSPSGPLWNRDLAEADEVAYGPVLDTTLDLVGADRIVVGHTTMREGRIGVRFGGRAFLIDTGGGPAYGGRVSALEIRDGTVRGYYPGEKQVLAAPPPLSDAEIERFLLEGRIVQKEEIPIGITKPSKVVLELDGKRRKAAFKNVDMAQPGVTRFERAPAEVNFTDSYRYDRAAYLLDRQLGMGMVPVVVLRRIGDTEGALVDWVEDAVDEQKRRQLKAAPPDPLALLRQQAMMEVFDALIANTDRNLGNQLFTTHDWKLHLIDHTRCFRLYTRLPEEFERLSGRVPRAMYERLRALDEESLVTLMDGVLTRSRVKALLSRRDHIVEKIERDRKEFGDVVVFFE